MRFLGRLGAALLLCGGWACAASGVKVFIFVRTDCPISNRYAPELHRLYDKFRPRGVEFALVYADAGESDENIAKHGKEYGFGIPSVRDPGHDLVKRAHATVTPEAAVFDGSGELVYHGRIDDRYVDFGKQRAAPSQHDLEDAIAATLAGKRPAEAATKAIGCYLTDIATLGPVTFYQDAAPIVYKNCAPCHHEGGSGPFALVSYEDVKKHARQIADVTRRRYMPPWLPEPGHGEFEDERRLTEREIEVLAEWAKQGAPGGDAAAAPSAPHFTPGWQLGPPDMVVEATKEFVVPAEGRDVFWNFILTPPLRETRYVRAIEIRPGNPRLVHHANLLVDRARTARLQEKSPGEGFGGMDLSIEADAFDPDSHFLFWKPGSAPYQEPDGLAWRLDPGDDLILNVHMQPGGKPQGERPSVGIYFSKAPQTKFPMLVQLERDGMLNIPAGDAAFRVGDDFTLPKDVDVLAVYPHAHYLGKVLEGYATTPGGEKIWLVRVPDWDLNWQGVFRYKRPLFLPQGSVISMRYLYDNSEANPRNPNHPPKQVVGGNDASDEMSHLWLQVLPRGEEDERPLLQEALMQHRLEKYPGDFSAHFNLGALALARKDAAGAVKHLREGLRAEPDQPVALNTLGAALLATGKTEEAIESFRHALRVQPGYLNSLYNLANALAEQGKLEEAAEDYRRVLKTDPGDAGARDHLTQVLQAMAEDLAAAKDFPRAAAIYQELADRSPQDAALRNSLGALYAQAGNFERAVEEFQAALRIDPSLSEARTNLELAREKLKN